jgi:hypothetical protein
MEGTAMLFDVCIEEFITGCVKIENQINFYNVTVEELEVLTKLVDRRDQLLITCQPKSED